MLFFYAVFRVRLVLFRHLQDCHNIFFRQRLEEANVSVSAENAFLSHFLDLGIGWMNAKFSEGDWHAYGVAPIFPGGDGKKGSGLYGRYCICRFWDMHIENFFPKLYKSARIGFVHISGPASPDGCKPGTVSHIKHAAKFMFNFVSGKIGYPSCPGETIMGKASGPHKSSPGFIVFRLLYSNLGCIVQKPSVPLRFGQ